MVVRNLTPSDYPKLADVHTSAFSGFFLTSLGTTFLRTYYKSCLKDKTTIACGITDEHDNFLGFATGTINSKGYHRRILFDNLFLFLISIGRAVLARPRILLRLIKNLEKNQKIEDKQDYSELLSIGVRPESKGKGIGEMLFFAFEKEAKERGAAKIALTTDLLNNDKVINFYYKCGLEKFYEFQTYPNRKMIKMIKEL